MNYKYPLGSQAEEDRHWQKIVVKNLNAKCRRCRKKAFLRVWTNKRTCVEMSYKLHACTILCPYYTMLALYIPHYHCLIQYYYTYSNHMKALRNVHMREGCEATCQLTTFFSSLFER